LAEETIVEASAGRRVSSDLAWLIDLLWGPAVQAGLARVRTDGTVPEGYVAVERFAVVPSLARPRFLVPLASRRVAWASTSRYNALRPAKVRALRAAIGAGMRVGAGHWALRDRLVVSVPAGAARTSLEALLIGAHLRSLLGAPDLVMGIGVREPHPNRKPTLQLLDGAGEVRGYVKVGWSPLTSELVRNEADALRACAAHPPPGLGVPTVLASGRWRDLDLVATSPLPARVRRHRQPLRPPPVTITRGLAATAGRRALPLGASPYWSSVRERVARVASGAASAAAGAATAASAGEIAATLGDCLARIEEHHRDTRFQFGRWHGDWVPWNLAWERERLFAWDWEHSGGDAPLGFDLLHWQFQVAFVQQRRSAAEAASRSAALAAPYLARLGIEPAAAGALPWMYLLELYLRAQRMQAAGAGWNARFHPAMLQVLRAARA
jgi:hypothetical protein